MMPSDFEYPAWDDIRVFLAVAEHGSFSAAARALRLGQPTISRRIAQLEDQIEEALFQRGAEGAVLTAAGERLLPAAKRMAEAAGDVARMATHRPTAPEGLVRIAAPPGVAFGFCAPLAGSLRQRLPGIRIEVRSAVAHIDLARGEADLALRTRCPTQRELVCLGELEVKQAAFAAPEYARTLPKGYDFADVAWIGWAPPFHDLPPMPQLEALIPGFLPVFTSDSYLVRQRAAEAGVGAVIMADTRHPRLSQDSNLVRLDLPTDRYKGTLHLVCAKSAYVMPRVRAVIGVLLEELSSLEDARFEPREG